MSRYAECLALVQRTPMAQAALPSLCAVTRRGVDAFPSASALSHTDPACLRGAYRGASSIKPSLDAVAGSARINKAASEGNSDDPTRTGQTPSAVGAALGLPSVKSVTHGPAGTGAQAGHDPAANGRGVHRLVALYRRVSRALSGGTDRADGTRQTDGRDIAAILARRAERVSNRKAAVADRYIAVHSILARGRS